jgi:hypothetical protein
MSKDESVIMLLLFMTQDLACLVNVAVNVSGSCLVGD